MQGLVARHTAHLQRAGLHAESPAFVRTIGLCHECVLAELNALTLTVATLREALRHLHQAHGIGDARCDECLDGLDAAYP